MNWEAVGAVGEILGAAGVIVTLGYLAAQMRASTSQARASMVLGLMASFNGSHNAVMENPQLADVYAKRLAGEELTPPEEIQWASVVNRLQNHGSVRVGRVFASAIAPCLGPEPTS